MITDAEPRATSAAFSVHFPEGRDRDAQRAEAELGRLAVAEFEAAFPRTQGFDHRRTRLRGTVEGAEIHVARGDFHAVVSVQRFVRRRAADSGGRAATLADGQEVRVVLRAGSTAARGARRLADALPRAWALASTAVGAAGGGAVGLAAAGSGALPACVALGGALAAGLGVTVGRLRGRARADAASRTSRSDGRLQRHLAQLAAVEGALVGAQRSLARELGAPFRSVA